jgi:hypothetical protein
LLIRLALHSLCDVCQELREAPITYPLGRQIAKMTDANNFGKSLPLSMPSLIVFEAPTFFPALTYGALALLRLRRDDL